MAEKHIFTIANVISRAFDIYVIFPLLLIITFFNSMQFASAIWWFFIYLLVLVVIPVMGDIYLVMKGRVSDWDLSIRKERIKYINIDSLLLLLLLGASILVNAPLLFKMLALILFSIEFLFGLVTLFWKISVHAQLVALLSIYAIVFLGPVYWIFVLFIPAIFFSRLYLKKHTFMQLFAGTLLSMVMALFVLAIFGYY